MRHDPTTQRVFAVIEPVCVSAGFELVDVRFTMDQGGWVLRVYVDRAGPEHEGEVDLHDCERLSRELSAVLDVEDPIPQAYSLEVSSPGIDRPLRTPEHFRRHIGEEAKIAMAVPVPVPGGERRNFKGVLREVDGDVVIIEIDGKDRFRLSIDDMDSARLVPDWDAVMHKGQKGQRPTQPAAKKARN